jgi:hypothetical protein
VRSSARVRAYDRRVRRGFSRALLFFLHIRPVIVNAIADSRIAAGVSGPGRRTLSFTIMVGLLVVGFVKDAVTRTEARA